MMMIGEPQYDQKKIRALREDITHLLIAKGLKEGCGKWATVFHRHFIKRKHTCYR